MNRESMMIVAFLAQGWVQRHGTLPSATQVKQMYDVAEAAFIEGLAREKKWREIERKMEGPR